MLVIIKFKNWKSKDKEILESKNKGSKDKEILIVDDDNDDEKSDISDFILKELEDKLFSKEDLFFKDDDNVEEDSIEEIKVQIIVKNKDIKTFIAKFLYVDYKNIIEEINLIIQSWRLMCIISYCSQISIKDELKILLFRFSNKNALFISIRYIIRKLFNKFIYL